MLMRAANRSLPARNVRAGFVLESLDGAVVEAPLVAGQLGVAIGRKLQRDAAKGRMSRIPRRQLADDMQHGVLDARVEQIVVGRQALTRRVDVEPGGAVDADPLQA